MTAMAAATIRRPQQRALLLHIIAASCCVVLTCIFCHAFCYGTFDCLVSACAHCPISCRLLHWWPECVHNIRVVNKGVHFINVQSSLHCRGKKPHRSPLRMDVLSVGLSTHQCDFCRVSIRQRKDQGQVYTSTLRVRTPYCFTLQLSTRTVGLRR